jgi:putative hydrolase of HD superfamily
MRPNETLLDLVLELQNLDRVARSGWTLRGVAEAESVTEHSWHVLFLVWALGQEIPEVDLHRALELAVVHDLAEVRLGDLPRTALRYLPAGAKKAAEGEAVGELLAPLPERARALWAEYAAGETAEARLVKACDKLQLMVKVSAYERWGAGGLAEFWDNPDNFPDGGFAPVAELFAELRRRRGR